MQAFFHVLLVELQFYELIYGKEHFCSSRKINKIVRLAWNSLHCLSFPDYFVL
jgi:hypothetical protein